MTLNILPTIAGTTCDRNNLLEHWKWWTGPLKVRTLTPLSKFGANWKINWTDLLYISVEDLRKYIDYVREMCCCNCCKRWTYQILELKVDKNSNTHFILYLLCSEKPSACFMNIMKWNHVLEATRRIWSCAAWICLCPAQRPRPPPSVGASSTWPNIWRSKVWWDCTHSSRRACFKCVSHFWGLILLKPQFLAGPPWGIQGMKQILDCTPKWVRHLWSKLYFILLWLTAATCWFFLLFPLNFDRKGPGWDRPGDWSVTPA